MFMIIFGSMLIISLNLKTFLKSEMVVAFGVFTLDHTSSHYGS